LRGSSLAAITAKFEAAVEHAMGLEAALEEAHSCGFDPKTVPFLMKPKELVVKKRDRSQVDMTLYEGGSASLRNVRKSCDSKRAAAATKAAEVEGRKEGRAAAQAEATAAAEQLIADFERCANGCACGLSPCPMEGLKACDCCRAAGRPWIKPRVCVVRECVAARKGPQVLALTFTGAAPSPPPRLTYDDGERSEQEDNAADEVMPIAKPPTRAVALCDWAPLGGCPHPEMLPEEVALGYCSGRRCKAKMHPECFLRHAGAAAAALDDVTCFCQGCWAKQ
jgi:hypothetical protein